MPEPIEPAWPARWVRWGEFLGPTPWQRCEGIELRGPWLVIHLDGTGRTVAVPDHIVRRRVEWTLTEEAPDA